jgi:hypothetical protein
MLRLLITLMIFAAVVLHSPYEIEVSSRSD